MMNNYDYDDENFDYEINPDINYDYILNNDVNYSMNISSRNNAKKQRNIKYQSQGSSKITKAKNSKYNKFLTLNKTIHN